MIKKLFKYLVKSIILILKYKTYFPFINIISLRTWLYKFILKKMGEKCTIGDNVTIKSVEKFSIGDRVSIHNGVNINAMSGITIGNNCGLSTNCTFIGGEHNHSLIDIPQKEQGLTLGPIIISDDVIIGNNSIITPGTVIGKGCYISAGTIVNGTIPEYSVIAGNPCRLIYNRKKKSFKD